VSETARQVDAHESSTWRYLLFFSGLSTIIVCTQQGLAHGMPNTTVLIPAFVALLVLLLLCQPWHRHLNVDVDTRVCCVEWRVFGLFPLGRRTYSLEGQQFSVLVVGPPSDDQDASTESSLGCLTAFLPFPLSLIGTMASGGGKKKAGVQRPWWVLALTDRETGAGKVLLDLANASVAEPVLRAVRSVLPDHVEMPPG
jgi:hypothetical protein